MDINVEIIGYIASAFIMTSLLMVSIVKLRFFGLIGACCFFLYGVLLQSVPIMITNASNMVIHLVYLTNMLRKKKRSFTYLSIKERRRFKLLDYIHHHIDDIKKRSPNYNEQKLDLAFSGQGKIYLALKNMYTVGFAFFVSLPDKSLYETEEEQELLDHVKDQLFPDETAYLVTDYISPKYRDMGLMDQLYKTLSNDIHDYSFIIVICQFTHKRFIRLLKRQGYVLEKKTAASGLFIKNLS